MKLTAILRIESGGKIVTREVTEEMPEAIGMVPGADHSEAENEALTSRIFAIFIGLQEAVDKCASRTGDA